MPSLMDYARGNVQLVRTFLACQDILYRLPVLLITARKPCEFFVPTKPRERYEAEVLALQEYVVTKTPAQRPADVTLALLMVHRVLWIAAAASQNFAVFVLVGLLQFVVAPYSFGIALFTSFMYFMTFCLGHLASVLLLLPLPLPSVTFELNLTFILCLLGVDFAACCYVAFVEAKGGKKPKLFSTKQTLQHMAYGTFNTKSFLLLVFLFCRGMRFNPVWLALEAALGISALVNNLVQRTCLSWECLFYNAHRLGHLRVIYEHAHKAHHRLHDTMAFDAHVYSGNGFPEEWFQIFYDIAVMRLLGAPPPVLTLRLLKLQYFNKDNHQRKESEAFQYHEDHHTVHRANFGMAHPMLDMYFGTMQGDNSSVQLGKAKFTKEETGDGLVKFRMQMVDGSEEYDPGTCQDLPPWQTWLAGKLSGSLL